VLDLLRLGWSPGSIAGRLARERGGGDAGRVSHEAIYHWVYAQSVATLRREWSRCGPGARRCTGLGESIGGAGVFLARSSELGGPP
jgi:IS30 family transposase